MLTLACLGCEPKLLVGSWHCPAPSRTADGLPTTSVTDPIAIPWSTSFETGLCDWDRALGYCYKDPNASFGVVSSPVHTGDQALAFTVIPAEKDGRQARCVREGALPSDATYGAWFYVPTLATSTGNWNLMHFQGSDPPADITGFWDVSLENGNDGGLHLKIIDYIGQPAAPPVYVSPTPIPIAEWFHVEFRWKRATDATGEVDLLQDGEPVVQVGGIATSAASWGQWYLGNLATALDEPDSTIYVDDVSIQNRR